MTQKTPFYSHHINLVAKIVDYAGFSMPIYYDSINEEHNQVREKAGLFDVSHMGQIIIEGDSVVEYLDRVTTNNISKLFIGKVQYSCILNDQGFVLDDLLVYKISKNKFMLVVNASNTKKIINWLNKQNKYNLNIINITSRNGLLAIQGPKALNILQKLTNFNLNDIKYYSFKYIDIMDIKNVLVSATGYTGAGGFEIYTDKDNIRKIWDYLFSLNNVDLSPIGLGARDTLRMEMGYCLYGNEINETTTPLEAGLSWIVDFSKDFIGRDALKSKKLTKKIIGFTLEERGIARNNYEIVNENNEKIGYVSSGTMSPFLNKSIGIGFLFENSLFNNIYILIRNRKIKAKLEQLPFVKKNN